MEVGRGQGKVGFWVLLSTPTTQTSLDEAQIDSSSLSHILSTPNSVWKTPFSP